MELGSKLVDKSLPPLLTERKVKKAKKEFTAICKEILESTTGGDEILWLKEQVNQLLVLSTTKFLGNSLI
jgi:hypothetical protein